MTGGMKGADLDDMLRLSSRLDDAAREIGQIASSTSTELASSAWVGPDAQRFVADWQSTYRADLASVTSSLDSAAEDVRQNAAGQEEASSAGASISAADVSKTIPVYAAAGVAASFAASGVSTLSSKTSKGIPTDDRSSQQKVEDATTKIKGWLDTGGLGVTKKDLNQIESEIYALEPWQRAGVIRNLEVSELAVLRDQMNESRIKGGWSLERKMEFQDLFDGHPDAVDKIWPYDYEHHKETTPEAEYRSAHPEDSNNSDAGPILDGTPKENIKKGADDTHDGPFINPFGRPF